jgi:hypothetical protein
MPPDFRIVRTLPPLAGVAALLAGPAVASAGSGQSAEYLPTLGAPGPSPVAIYGGSPKAILHTGGKLHTGEWLMRVKVDGPAHSGIQLRLTCPSGSVVGYGYAGPDGLAVNGKDIAGRHAVRPKVQASVDLNKDGRFTGTVYALCEG